MAHGPRKKPLDFGGNPDHVTLGLRLGYGYGEAGPSYASVTVTILQDYGFMAMSLTLVRD